MRSLTPGDVRGIHAEFGRPDEVIEQRRTIYSGTVELLSGRPAAELDAEVLDNPAVRGHIGAVLAGSVALDVDQLRPAAELVASSCVVDVAGRAVRLASTAVAQSALSGALRRVAEELRRHGDVAQDVTVLTAADEAFARARATTVKGLHLVVHLVPDLVLDLVPHIGMLALLARTSSGRLGSASAREFPGLVLIPDPDDPMEVAEAVVHEGAHQKFFDLAMTRSLLGPDPRNAPVFTPGWAPPGAPAWSMEQSFAAFHAYCCLSVLADEASRSAHVVELHAGSLLPHARSRMRAIGEWLVSHGDHLGPDGRSLVARLHGQAPEVRTTSRADWIPLPLGESEERRVVIRCGTRALVAQAGHPADLYWVDWPNLLEPSAEVR
jgi:hypothetical protein